MKMFVPGNMMSTCNGGIRLAAAGGILRHKFATVPGVSLVSHSGQALTVRSSGILGQDHRHCFGEIWEIPDNVLARLTMAENILRRRACLCHFSYYDTLGAALQGRGGSSPSYTSVCSVYLPAMETNSFPSYDTPELAAIRERLIFLRITDMWLEDSDGRAQVVSVSSTPDSVALEEDLLPWSLVGEGDPYYDRDEEEEDEEPYEPEEQEEDDI